MGDRDNYQVRLVEDSRDDGLIPDSLEFGQEIDIPKRAHDRYTHDLFKFPAKFHPPLCRWAISKFSRPGEWVLDPMMGVGTILVEAKVANRNSVGVDIDPLAIFMTKVKTTAIQPSRLRDSNAILLEALEPYWRKKSEIEDRKRRDLSDREYESATAGLSIPDFPDPFHWFRKYVVVDLAVVRQHVRKLFSDKPDLRDFYLACLAASLRRVSNADPTPVSGLEVTKHMKALIARGYEIDVFGEFSRRIQLNTQRMNAFYEAICRSRSEETQTLAVHSDVRNLSSEWRRRGLEPPSFAMTSPPYCNAIEYWRRHRLEYLWLDLMRWEDIPDFSRRFVGSTTIRRKELPDDIPPEVDTPQLRRVVKHLRELGKNQKAAHVVSYFVASVQYMQQVGEVLQPDAKFMIVVGNSRTNGVVIPTSEILMNIAVKNGLGLFGAFHYEIKDRIMQYPAAGAGVIPQEWVLILQRK